MRQNPHVRICLGGQGQQRPWSTRPLVGDRVWAATGGEGAGGCPTIPIIDNVRDAAALAAVMSASSRIVSKLHSRSPPAGSRLQFGGNLIDYSVVAGLRRWMSTTGLNWDASVNIGTSEVDQFDL